MNSEEFAELVSYVSRNVDHDLDDYALRQIDDLRCDLSYACSELAYQIDDYAEEWCVDNGIEPYEYYDYGVAEEVFYHDNY